MRNISLYRTTTHTYIHVYRLRLYYLDIFKAIDFGWLDKNYYYLESVAFECLPRYDITVFARSSRYSNLYSVGARSSISERYWRVCDKSSFRKLKKKIVLCSLCLGFGEIVWSSISFMDIFKSSSPKRHSIVH